MADRSDEKRDDLRGGDVLGLGGAVNKSSDIPDNTVKSPRRRRHRALEEPITESSDAPTTQKPGATGIDMGSGGEGTDIE